MTVPLSPRPRGTRPLATCLVLFAGVLSGCLDVIPPQPFCADSHPQPAAVTRAVTWHQDIQPLVAARCARCHGPDGNAPFALQTYDDAFKWRAAIRQAVATRAMPPWFAAPCCNTFTNDVSLTDPQIALVDAWVAAGAPEGDATQAGESLPAIGGLSRVDVTVSMSAPYLPMPRPGRVDDHRCFVLDWPLSQGAYVTGFSPRPGARKVVHHLVVAAVKSDHGEDLRRLEGKDGRPGFACEGALGQLQVQAIIGGSLVGSDYPDGLGHFVPPGMKLVLNVHYSLAGAMAEPDQTRLDFRVDPIAKPFKTLPIANPAWLIADGMRVGAGEKDKIYSFQYDPVLLTQKKTIFLRGYSPHMHALASRQKFAVVRGNGQVDCMTEIPAWEFGWEQPYWFATPVRFDKGDQLFVQCHFDNSAENQPIVGGVRQPPRDIAWGAENQDMCAGFVTYTVEP